MFSRLWTVAWCSSCCKLFHVVSVIGWDNERADINSRRLWGARRDSVFAGGERQTLWNSPKTCCGLWWTCYERGQCPKMVHNVYEWANRCSWRWEIRATLWIARRPSGMRREKVNWCHGTTSASMSKVTMWRSRWRCVIKPAYSVSFLLSISIFVWQNVLYFLDAPRTSIHTANQQRVSVVLATIIAILNFAF